MLETLVRPNSTEEQDRPFISPDAQPPPCFRRSEIRVRKGIVNRMADHRHCAFTNTKILEEFSLHLLRMNEDVIGQSILNFQCKAIEQRIVRVPSGLIHIVRSESDLLPQQFVIKQQQSSIKVLELVVPKNM